MWDACYMYWQFLSLTDVQWIRSCHPSTSRVFNIFYLRSAVPLIVYRHHQVYEYSITLGDEIRYKWPPKRTFGSALYFVNRYVPFGGAVIYAVGTTTHSSALSLGGPY